MNALNSASRRAGRAYRHFPAAGSRRPTRAPAIQMMEFLETRTLLSGPAGAGSALLTTTVDAPVIIAAGDRFEPNDSFAAATDLGTLGNRVESGLSIHAPYNDDYYRFTAAVSGVQNIAIAFTHAQGDLDLFTYDAGFHSLGSSEGTTDTEQVALTVTAGNVYYFKVAGFDGATNPSYTLSVSSPSGSADRFEPNDSFATATDLGTLGSRTESDLSIHAARNSDYFRFTPAATGPAHVAIAFSHALGDLDLYLYDSNSLEIGSSTSTTDNEQIDMTLTAGATYFVEVAGYNGATNPSYTLQVSAGMPAWLVDDGALDWALSGSPDAPLLTISAGAGHLTADAGTAVPGLQIVVGNHASLRADANQTLGGLEIADGGVFLAAAESAKLFLIGSLSIAPGGQLDLAGSDLVLTGAAPGSFDAIRQSIADGRIGSSASGQSAALAPVDNQLLHLATWQGQSINDGVSFSQVIIKFAWQGDTNLDGQVTQDDYRNVLANMGSSGQWLTGDLNGDGMVTPDDLAIVSANIGVGTGAGAGPALAVAATTGITAPALSAPPPESAPPAPTAPRRASTHARSHSAPPSAWAAPTSSEYIRSCSTIHSLQGAHHDATRELDPDLSSADLFGRLRPE